MQPIVSQTAPAEPDKPPLPLRPRSIEATGLTLSFIADQIVRALYIVGEMTGVQLVELLHLPWENVLDQAMNYLRREQMAEVKGSSGLGEKAYRYQATTKGITRAKEIGERTQYLGPAPVNLHDYSAMMRQYTTQGLMVTEAAIREAFAHLVINDSLLMQLGPAIKTPVARSSSSVMPGMAKHQLPRRLRGCCPTPLPFLTPSLSMGRSSASSIQSTMNAVRCRRVRNTSTTSAGCSRGARS